MRILVTGASGFIGEPVATRLAAKGHDVLCVCRLPSNVGVGSRVFWDMRDPAPPCLPSGIEAVAHLAQARNFRRFPENAREIFQVNVAATATLLDLAVKAGVQRFVLVSTGTVYEPFSGPLVEDQALNPIAYLGASKLAAEIIARPYAAKLRLGTVRVFFPYGPGQKDRIVPDLIRRVRNGEAVTIAGSAGGLRLTPTYVDDVADVIVTAVEQGWTDTCNVAAPHSATVQTVAETIGRLLGREPRFEFVDRPAPQIVPNLDRLASRYDLNRFISLEEGLRRTLAREPVEI